jgi:hypothetical protein
MMKLVNLALLCATLAAAETQTAFLKGEESVLNQSEQDDSFVT